MRHLYPRSSWPKSIHRMQIEIQIFIFSLSICKSLPFWAEQKFLRSIDVKINELSPTVILLRFSRSSSSLFESLVSSPIEYHHLCIAHPTRLCFRDDIYLCLCEGNHSRVECFLYDDQLDRCSHCLNNGRCLKGDPHQSSDLLCLCPECHSGQQCQFNTKSFVSLWINFSSAIFSPINDQQRFLSSFSSLFYFSSWLSPNNLFSFLTLRRRPCLRHGVGHYLLWMSVINQINLAFFVLRLIHLTVKISDQSPSLMWDDLFCKSLNYLLSLVHSTGLLVDVSHFD